MYVSVHNQIRQDVTFPKIYAYVGTFLVVIQSQVFKDEHTISGIKSRSVKVRTILELTQRGATK